MNILVKTVGSKKRNVKNTLMKSESKNEAKAGMLSLIYEVIIVGLIVIILFLYKVTIEEKTKQDMIQQFKQQEKSCIVTALYHEARGEGELGMKAVANVIHNRYTHPNYPDTYCGVINQYKQFSYTIQGKPNAEVLRVSLQDSSSKNKKALDSAEKIAEELVEEKFNKFLPENVLHYATTSVKNYWTKTKKVVAQIGNHKFYAEKENK